MRVQTARRELDQQIGQAKALAAEARRASGEVTGLKAQVELHSQVLAVLTSVGEARQESAQRQVEELVTRGLQTIFGENLSFHLVPGERAGQATLDFIIRSEYTAGDEAGVNADAPLIIDTPVLEARGGGMAVVVAFMLRLVVLLLTPAARRILFLDESFAHVSAEYRPRLAEFLREVADKAGVQIVMVSHDPEYEDVADTSYRLALGPDGTTEVVAQ